jgi:hypothetical protein
MNKNNTFMDRIQIGGEWYVKESTINQPQHKELTVKDLTYSETYIYETDKYSWEASRVYNENREPYDTVMIEFIDKRPLYRPEPELWDNNSWFIAVLEGNSEALKEAREAMDEEGIRIFREFLGVLVEENWL